MSKNKKNTEIIKEDDEMIEEDNQETEIIYPYKYVDEYNLIDIEDISRVQISHDGSGEFIVIFYSKTGEKFEINNKFFENIDDVKLYLWVIFQTNDCDVRDYNYVKENPGND